MTVRYFASLPGDAAAKQKPRELDVQATAPGSGKVTVKIDGRAHALDVSFQEPGTLNLLLDGEVRTAVVDDRGDTLVVHIDGVAIAVEIADERRLRMRQGASGASAEGKQTLTAPMPGKVVKVLAAVGAQVKAGQGLVIIEAMKMENELKSPKDGTVLEVAVKEGQAVEAGQKLLSVE
jgi:biotin carboxyl carrier protein